METLGRVPRPGDESKDQKAGWVTEKGEVQPADGTVTSAFHKKRDRQRKRHRESERESVCNQPTGQSHNIFLSQEKK